MPNTADLLGFAIHALGPQFADLKMNFPVQTAMNMLGKKWKVLFVQEHVHRLL